MIDYFIKIYKSDLL